MTGDPGLVDTPLIASFKADLQAASLAIADPAEAAHAVEAILDSGDTGRAWIVQAGRPATPIDYPQVEIAQETPSTEAGSAGS